MPSEEAPLVTPAVVSTIAIVVAVSADLGIVNADIIAITTDGELEGQLDVKKGSVK